MRKRSRPQPDRALTLTPLTLDCPDCQQRTHADYNKGLAKLPGVLNPLAGVDFASTSPIGRSA